MSSASFWQWFAGVSGKFASDIENADLLQQLDGRVELLNPAFPWEMGSGKRADWCLAISPNLDAKLLPETEAVVAQAPLLERWEFASARARWAGFSNDVLVGRVRLFP